MNHSILLIGYLVCEMSQSISGASEAVIAGRRSPTHSADCNEQRTTSCKVTLKKKEPKLIIKSFPTDVRKKRVSHSHHEQLFRQFGITRGNYLLKALI